MLLRQLERRLEEVHVEPDRGIKFGQHVRGREALEPPVANDPPHHRAVLLLHPSLVVLPVGPAAGERDRLGGAVIPHRLVHEHGVVVGVEAQQLEGQVTAQFLQHRDQQRLLSDEQRRAFGPAGGDIGQHQRLHEAAVRSRSAVRDQVRLDEPRWRIVPVGEGPDRNAPPDRRWCAPLVPSQAIALRIPQGAVDRRRAHRQQKPAHLGIERKVSMPLHRLDQHRQDRPKPLAANPVGRLPDHQQRGPHRFAVDAAPRPRARPRCRSAAAQQPHGVLAVEPRHRHELVEYARLLIASAPRVPAADRSHQLTTRLHAHPPHPALPANHEQGSISGEATAQHPGAFLARQCGFSS